MRGALFLFLLIGLSWASCAPEPKAAGANGNTSTESAAPAEKGAGAATVQPQATKNSEAAAAPEKTEGPVIGSRPPQQPTDFAGTLTLSGEQLEAATGEEICMKVKVADFSEVLTMQYSMRWDATVLEFTGLRDLSLPFLTENNFGAHRVGEGILTFVWIDNSLKGVNLPDGSSIYQVCFEVTGKTGSSSAFQITGDPTPLESVNKQEKLLKINPVAGSVTVR